MRNAVIVSAVRTPVGSFGGSLKTVPVVELGTCVMKDLLKRAGLKPALDPAQEAFSPDALRGQGAIDLEKRGMITMAASRIFLSMRSSWATSSRRPRARTRPASP